MTLEKKAKIGELEAIIEEKDKWEQEAQTAAMQLENQIKKLEQQLNAKADRIQELESQLQELEKLPPHDPEKDQELDRLRKKVTCEKRTSGRRDVQC